MIMINLIKKLLFKFEIFRFYSEYRLVKKFFNFLKNKKKIKNKPNLINLPFEFYDKKYNIYVNNFDLRSYLITKNRQHHKINFLKNNLWKGTFIDIGSNYGEFSIVLKSYQKKLYLFEPNKLVYLASKETFKNIPNVKIFNNAVSNIEEKKTIQIYPFNSGGSNLNLYKQTKYDLFHLPIYFETQTIKIDKFIKNTVKNFKDVINIKIDIEGLEVKVLQSLLNISNLKELKLFIMFENNHLASTNKIAIKKVLKSFANMNFKFIQLIGKVDEVNNYSSKEYTSVNDIDLNLLSEICILNYDIF